MPADSAHQQGERTRVHVRISSVNGWVGLQRKRSSKQIRLERVNGLLASSLFEMS